MYSETEYFARTLCDKLANTIQSNKDDPLSVIYCAYSSESVIVVFEPAPRRLPHLKMGAILNSTHFPNEKKANSFSSIFVAEVMAPGFGLTDSEESLASKWCSLSPGNVYLMDYPGSPSNLDSYPRTVGGLRGLDGFAAIIDDAA